MKNLCPLHGNKLTVSKVWEAPDGLDPKMRRYSCLACTDYWYKAPKHGLMQRDEIQLQFGVTV